MAGGDRDRSAIEGLEASLQDAWNRHSVGDFSSLLTEDVDFVTVGGTWLKGRRDFERHHEPRFRTQFKDSRMRIDRIQVDFLRADLALAHVEWRLEGDRDPDGAPRMPREGIFTHVVVKDQAVWRIRASQNTNKVALHPPSGPGANAR